MEGSVIVDVIDRESLGYIAGIIDGEGCITITKTVSRKRMCGFSYDLYVTVSMADEIIPRWLCEKFGGSLHKDKKAKEYHRGTLRWRVCSKQARSFLDKVIPHLRVKRQQAMLGRAFQNNRKPSGFYNQHNRKPQEVMDIEEYMYQEMRKLNHTWKEAS